jgi:hypothetical protein
MDQAIFDKLQHTLTATGPEAAIDRLCESLREQKDYASLFYALLLKKRHELGISPIPTGPADELPEAVHEPYEEAIRQAARTVGGMYLEQGNIPQAWLYFRMIGEPEPVAAALEKYRPGQDEDAQPVVEIAYHHGVHPRRGFDLVLERYGICSAITLLGSQEFPHGAEARDYCIKRLVRALHRELIERLGADIARQEGTAPAEARTVRELVAGRDYLFEEGFYHIDVSHLSAVVQMSIHLAPGEELNMARELCAYGRRLSPQFQYPGNPPFENQYHDYGIYLDALAGEGVDEAVEHFERKAAEADPENVGTEPAEVLVNLLLRLGRPREALAAARRFLAGTQNQRLSCPSITELCRQTDDYQALADVAREQGDAVHFLAGLLARTRLV